MRSLTLEGLKRCNQLKTFPALNQASGGCTRLKTSLKRKRTEIAIEIEELIYLGGRRGGPTSAWCSDCGSETLMATPQQAAAIARSSVRAVNRRVEAGDVHFLETPEGLLLVCVNSLDWKFEKE